MWALQPPARWGSHSRKGPNGVQSRPITPDEVKSKSIEPKCCPIETKPDRPCGLEGVSQNALTVQGGGVYAAVRRNLHRPGWGKKANFLGNPTGELNSATLRV